MKVIFTQTEIKPEKVGLLLQTNAVLLLSLTEDVAICQAPPPISLVYHTVHRGTPSKSPGTRAPGRGEIHAMRCASPSATVDVLYVVACFSARCLLQVFIEVPFPVKFPSPTPCSVLFLGEGTIVCGRRRALHKGRGQNQSGALLNF